MDEAAIAQSLEEQIGIADLQIQVVKQENDLIIIFNRSDETHLDYSALTKKTIGQLKQFRLPPPGQITFYSRILGVEEPDWETTIKISTKAPQPVTISSPEPTPIEEVSFKEIIPEPEELLPIEDQIIPDPTPTEEPQLETPPIEAEIIPEAPRPAPKLSDFCFTRNKALVKTDLPSPAKRVAEGVKFFHELSESDQLEVAAVLEDFFKSPDKTSLVSVPEELRSWFEELKKLKDIEFKSQSVWLSRYCFDQEKTMNEVNSLFTQLAEIEEAKEKEAARIEEENRPAPPPSKRSSNQQQSSRSGTTNTATGSQRFSPDELLFMIGGAILIGGIGWFLWGTVRFLGLRGWIAAFAGIASGIGTILGSQAIKTGSGIALLIVYVLSFGAGFIIIFVEFLAWLIGLIIGGGVSAVANQSGAPSVLAPKPFRLLAVFSIVILIGVIYAITNSPIDRAVKQLENSVKFEPLGAPQQTIEVKITDSSLTMGANASKTALQVNVVNQSAKLCELDIEILEGGSVQTSGNTDIPPGGKSEILLQLSPGRFLIQCEPDDVPDSLAVKGPVFTAIP